MQSITALLTQKIANAFLACGYDQEYGTVVFSKTAFCQFQCNGALAAAKRHKRNPMDIAHEVKATVGQQAFFTVDVVNPGFINLNLADDFLAGYCSQMLQLDQLGFEPSLNPLSIIIDYGGPNIAKPLHVGHLRSAIIGQAIKNTARFIGHTVVGDVHLGDWGLQMGMVMAMFIKSDEHLASLINQNRTENLIVYPIAIQDLETIYPQASALAKQDNLFLAECRRITAELQKGNETYTALWRNIVRTSVEDLKKNYAKLNVDFEEWKGESDSQPVIPSMVDDLKQRGYAYPSEGALVVDVALPSDTSPIPPLILSKSDGASLYSTTDLATIIQRKSQYEPDYILYVVDKRQDTHFQQVFRCADKVGLTQPDLRLEFIAFGTMNGKDGKPFKTRDGGVMKLSLLIDLIVAESQSRLQTVSTSTISAGSEQAAIAKVVGLAALKFGDLINARESDYIFDVDKFTAFEGKTGPYLLYSAVRIKSILAKAAVQQIPLTEAIQVNSAHERALLLKITELYDVIHSTFDKRMPNVLAEYVYSLANLYNSFYHESHVLNEVDQAIQRSLVSIMSLSLKCIETCVGLLGISVPDRM